VLTSRTEQTLTPIARIPMRTTPRHRRPIGTLPYTLLRPLLRFSYTRDAYVVRVVGNRVGPVFVRRREIDSAPAEPEGRTEP
jgi:hypothetical protein